MSEFADCQYRYSEDYYGEEDLLYCENKPLNDNLCDNCKQNIHLNCSNYNPKRDMCLKWFEEGISQLKECKEKTVFNDDALQKKWSN